MNNYKFFYINYLDILSDWALTIECKGNRRYGVPRYVYPPGEATRFEETDPRKALKSDVNMVAVSSGMMQKDDILLWIYHSPHLQLFVKRIMQYNCIFPYNTCDLGLAMNISRPAASEDNRKPTNVALGFHFDSINSSPSTDTSNTFAQARGATGNLGNINQTNKIQSDCHTHKE